MPSQPFSVEDRKLNASVERSGTDSDRASERDGTLLRLASVHRQRRARRHRGLNRCSSGILAEVARDLGHERELREGCRSLASHLQVMLVTCRQHLTARSGTMPFSEFLP